LLSYLLNLLASLLDTLLKILRSGRVVGIQQAVRGLHRIYSGLLRLLLLLGSASLLGAVQLLSRLPQILCGLLHLGIVLLCRLLLELTRYFFQIAPELLDVPLVVFRILVLRGSLPLQLLLLAPGQFFQFVGRFLFLGRLLLLAFTALDGFILVLALVQFEFEQVGKVLGILLATATAAATTAAAALALLDLDLGVKRRSFSEVVVSFALKRNGCAGIRFCQVFGDRAHALDSFIDVLGEFLDHRVGARELTCGETAH
jgi:hypothetical protein